VKRSGRDEPIWVVIHICIVTTLGLSLYNYLYLKLAKTLCFSYYLLSFLFNKFGDQEVRTHSAWKWWRVVQIMYTHVGKCKNDKTKNKKVKLEKKDLKGSCSFSNQNSV
jgi:hypothetical protein